MITRIRVAALQTAETSFFGQPSHSSCARKVSSITTGCSEFRQSRTQRLTASLTFSCDMAASLRPAQRKRPLANCSGERQFIGKRRWPAGGRNSTPDDCGGATATVITRWRWKPDTWVAIRREFCKQSPTPGNSYRRIRGASQAQRRANSHAPHLQTLLDRPWLAIPSSDRFVKTLEAEQASLAATSASPAVPNRAMAAGVQSFLRSIRAGVIRVGCKEKARRKLRRCERRGLAGGRQAAGRCDCDPALA